MDKSSELRSTIAEQILDARKNDRALGYVTDRTLSEYQSVLHGVSNFIDYILKNKNQLGSNILLDVGAGATRAASQLRSNYAAKGLEVRATVLSNTPQIEKYLGKASTVITSAESLKGIKANSIAGIISVSGLAYSNDFSKVAESIDRVLVPGGIFKSGFVAWMQQGREQFTLHSSMDMEQILREKGYDVSAERIGTQMSYSDVILAIKPPFLDSAANLMKADRLKTGIVRLF